MNAKTPKAIVPTLVYEGSSHVLNGASKAGKSTLATQLAICVATGKSFLGIEVARQRVLLVSLEMSAGLVRDRIRDIARDVVLPMPEPEWFHVVAPIPGETPQIHLTDPEGAALLRRLIEETGAKLVILDTLYRFLPGTDFSDNGEMGQVMGTANSIANDTGAAILIVHHTKKGPNEGPVSQSGLGAQIIGGAANVVMMLKREHRGWDLSVESHYAAPDEPISYGRPIGVDGIAGAGCVLSNAAEVRGLDEESVRRAFVEHGSEIAPGIHFFPSMNQLASGLTAAGLAGNRDNAMDTIRAIENNFAGENGPIAIGSGPRRAHTRTRTHIVAISRTCTSFCRAKFPSSCRARLR